MHWPQYMYLMARELNCQLLQYQTNHYLTIQSLYQDCRAANSHEKPSMHQKYHMNNYPAIKPHAFGADLKTEAQ